MELSLIRSLMDKEFYDDNRGAKCPTKIFSKDVQKIKRMIDTAMDRYNRTVTPGEIEALFRAENPTMTTAQKDAYAGMFRQIEKESVLGNDIAGEVLSKLFQKFVGEEIANLGIEYISGERTSLEDVRSILEQYGDDFTPNLKIEWEDISIESLMDDIDLQSQWKFNIPSLARKIDGISSGQLIEVGARPNTGKTSFHASLIAGPNGFASQGAKCVILCNEEKAKRVASRYLTAAAGMDKYQIKADLTKARDLYAPVHNNIKIKDASGRDMAWVESVCKAYKPDVLILDMGDKFARTGGFARYDEALKHNAIHARNIAKQYECAVFYMSQLSAEAEGKIQLNQSMMEGSRTGKAAEADLMLLIAKDVAVQSGAGDEVEESPIRHITVAKNKLNGWHGRIICELEYQIARYVN